MGRRTGLGLARYVLAKLEALALQLTGVSLQSRLVCFTGNRASADLLAVCVRAGLKNSQLSRWRVSVKSLKFEQKYQSTSPTWWRGYSPAMAPFTYTRKTGHFYGTGRRSCIKDWGVLRTNTGVILLSGLSICPCAVLHISFSRRLGNSKSAAIGWVFRTLIPPHRITFVRWKGLGLYSENGGREGN